jgi:hypothetical protein
VDLGGRHVRIRDAAGKQMSCPAFSPDGHSLAYRTPEEIVVQPIETAGAVGLAQRIPIIGAGCEVWAPAGDRFALMGAGNVDVAIVKLDGTSTTIWRPCLGSPIAPDRPIAWSPRGDNVRPSWQPVWSDR